MSAKPMRKFLLFLFVLIPLTTIVGAFVVSTLWGWFAVGLGLPPLSIPVAGGLQVLRLSIVGVPQANSDKGPGTVVTEGLVREALYLGVGYLLHLWVVAP